VCPTNAAWYIFTSGSTSIPKGVVLEHASIVASLQAHGARYAGPVTKALQFSAFNFDASISDVFTTLIYGGCVSVIAEEARLNNLAESIRNVCANFAFLTPTVAGLLKPHEVPTLETIVLVGEALNPEVLEDWVGSHVRLFNAYGPSECSILTTFSSEIVDKDLARNIGTALAGSNLWVVDPTDHHELVPVGCVGELLVEGPLLARGYLGDDQKTADSFVTPPAWVQRYNFNPNSSRRFYKTGDLVSQEMDGSLVYIGRRDTMVKINSQRVELGEIEHWVKRKLPEVREVVAGLVNAQRSKCDSDTQESVLAVAIELRMTDESCEEPISPALLPISDDLRRTFSEARKALLGVLPIYMVPQLYLPVTKLALTDSGKLDRRTIWKVIEQSTSLGSYFLVDRMKVQPSTRIEKQLQELWATVLNMPSKAIGANDDFFALGGDSISAMRLVSRARQSAQLSLNVADILRHSVLSDLAAAADSNSTSGLATPEYEPFSALRAEKPHDTLIPAILRGGISAKVPGPPCSCYDRRRRPLRRCPLESKFVEPCQTVRYSSDSLCPSSTALVPGRPARIQA
jgi:amino acid adenylation domain-containing protein